MHFEYAFDTVLPIDVVYQTLRDDLIDLARYLPNVKYIELLDREETAGGIKITNKWHGKYLDQSLVGRVTHVEEIAWIDKAEWIDDARVCNWSYEPFILKDYIKVHGKNTFSSDGGHTTITITGDLAIDLAQYPLVHSELKSSINEELTKDFLELIRTNFATLIKGLEEYVKKRKNHDT